MRQFSRVCRPPKYLTGVCPSNIYGVNSPKIFDRCMSVKHLNRLHPQNNLTDVCPSNIWRAYSPKIFDGCMSVKYLEGLHPQNI